MPYEATVYNVMIASPGDVQRERSLVREVIHEWNAINSSSRKMVLQPIGWETHSHPSMEDRAQGVLNKQILKDADLLVAIFWTKLGSPTGRSPSGTIEEIDEHIKSGKPAMLYFSDAPVRPDSVDDAQYRALMEAKERYKAKGLIETFESPTEFRQKFSRQLASNINSDAYFETEGGEGVPSIPAPDRDVPQLSNEATEILLEATKDRDGRILHARYIGGVDLQTNGRQFIEQDNPRSRAAWEGAIRELQVFGLVEDMGHEGEVFQVTREGYSLAEVLTA